MGLMALLLQLSSWGGLGIRPSLRCTPHLHKEVHMVPRVAGSLRHIILCL